MPPDGGKRRAVLGPRVLLQRLLQRRAHLRPSTSKTSSTPSLLIPGVFPSKSGDSPLNPGTPPYHKLINQMCLVQVGNRASWMRQECRDPQACNMEAVLGGPAKKGTACKAEHHISGCRLDFACAHLTQGSFLVPQDLLEK